MLRYFFILMVLVPQLVRADGAALDPSKYFQEYLAKCGTNEIRCIWFLDNRPNVGELMTFNLIDDKVFTERDVYNWAHQNAGTRKLTRSQMEAIQRFTGELPPSGKDVEFSEAVSVSFWKEGTLQMFRYDRQHVPSVIEHIYDISGGYFTNENHA